MTLYYLGQKSNGAPCFITFATQDNPRVTWGPLYFTTEEMAKYALANPIPYLSSIQDNLGIFTEDLSSVLQGLALGYPGLKPDWLSFNEGLVPLTPEGARLLGQEGGNTWGEAFSGEIDEGSLPEMVLREIGRHLEISPSVLHLDLLSIRKAEELARETSQHLLGDFQVEELEAFMEEAVQIEILPEQTSDLSKGYWIRTRGMQALGRPELEVRSIPAVALEPLRDEMFSWMLYFYLTPSDSSEPVPTMGELNLTLLARESSDPFWSDQGLECRTLTVMDPPLQPTPIASPLERVLH